MGRKRPSKQKASQNREQGTSRPTQEPLGVVKNGIKKKRRRGNKRMKQLPKTATGTANEKATEATNEQKTSPAPSASASAPSSLRANDAGASGPSRSGGGGGGDGGGGGRRGGRVLTELQQRMRDKLEGGEFRRLNEQLYTVSGGESYSLYRGTPRLFEVYHSGYRKQVERWPRNPLDDIIGYLRGERGDLRVADLGCGEGRLGKEISQSCVHSFDLVAANERITACNIADVPLPDSAVDVAVFCLSLMGTNYADFLHEAWRILCPKTGLLLIAEVASRFPNHDPTTFIRGVESLGFSFLPQHPLVKLQHHRYYPQHQRHGHHNMPRKDGNHRHDDDNTDDDGDDHDDNTGPPQSGSAFFFQFAFVSKKVKNKEKHQGKGSGNGKKNGNGKKHNLPELAACIYKRR